MEIREGGRLVELVPCPNADLYWLMYGEQFTDGEGKHWMRAEHAGVLDMSRTSGVETSTDDWVGRPHWRV